MLTKHVKELFSKLRFSYVEQVTKEKFLRAIVGDPPLVVGHNENVEMEAQLAEVKADLKARKEEVRTMVEEMEKLGRDLANRECSLVLRAITACVRDRVKDCTNDRKSVDRVQECPATNEPTLNTSRVDRKSRIHYC